ncbi:MAG: LysR family transcriptional regulator [Rhodocyclaceae bacterium]|nr:LysR family transcriptional regulator [Rhodocyclaceae bacterium]MBK6907911.1 LysR family transcriptional regulator [Rhodocyclaceae bacterium]
MDRTAEMAAFVRTVQSGGFTAAARAMELTPSAVSKLVARLEDRLGVRLLQRTTRRIEITPEGDAFFHRARDILAALDEAEAEVTTARDNPSGRLRLVSGAAFGAHQLTPAVPAFLALYPKITLDLTLTDVRARSREENFDLAIRVGPLDDSSVVARRICSLERLVVASPAYLETHGCPQHPDELSQHRCLWNSSLPALRDWPFKDGESVRSVRVVGPVVVNNNETLRNLALAGVGIARLPDVMIGDDLRSGRLLRILDDHAHHEPVTVFATYASGRNLSPKVRVMIDFLTERFGSAPWRWRAPAADADRRIASADLRTHGGSVAA